jgi:hypothetical protein
MLTIFKEDIVLIMDMMQPRPWYRQPRVGAWGPPVPMAAPNWTTHFSEKFLTLGEVFRLHYENERNSLFLLVISPGLFYSSDVHLCCWRLSKWCKEVILGPPYVQKPTKIKNNKVEKVQSLEPGGGCCALRHEEVIEGPANTRPQQS